MSLTSIFMAHIPRERREQLNGLPSDDVLLELVRLGRQSWPTIALSDADFVAFLGRCVPASGIGPQLHAGDLWLVCGYGRGLPEAIEAVETRYMPRARNLLRRMGVSPTTLEDILQELREKLVEMSAPEPDKAGYSGRGDLGGWLCIVAVHAANRRNERGEKEQTLESSEALLLPAPDDDPEMAFLRREYRDELIAAFREALNSLSARDRNLLRYYFLDGLSIDKVGAIYGIHRVTASRWVNQVRETLCGRTREYLSQRVTLSESGFQRVLGLIESQIRVNLEGMSA